MTAYKLEGTDQVLNESVSAFCTALSRGQYQVSAHILNSMMNTIQVYGDFSDVTLYNAQQLRTFFLASLNGATSIRYLNLLTYRIESDPAKAGIRYIEISIQTHDIYPLFRLRILGEFLNPRFNYDSTHVKIGSLATTMYAQSVFVSSVRNASIALAIFSIAAIGFIITPFTLYGYAVVMILMLAYNFFHSDATLLRYIRALSIYFVMYYPFANFIQNHWGFIFFPIMASIVGIAATLDHSEGGGK